MTAILVVIAALTFGAPGLSAQEMDAVHVVPFECGVDSLSNNAKDELAEMFESVTRTNSNILKGKYAVTLRFYRDTSVCLGGAKPNEPDLLSARICTVLTIILQRARIAIETTEIQTPNVVSNMYWKGKQIAVQCLVSFRRVD